MENKSSFQFKGYKIFRSLIEINDSKSDKLTVNFEPKGTINNTDKSFFLNLNIKIFDKDKNINIEVEFLGEYVFTEKDDNFKAFLYVNSPAILFPYIRSYITALTALSGISPIILPTMNMSGLKEKLENNITEIN
jgi:preprotein translocase subunit SecB